MYTYDCIYIHTYTCIHNQVLHTQKRTLQRLVMRNAHVYLSCSIPMKTDHYRRWNIFFLACRARGSIVTYPGVLWCHWQVKGCSLDHCGNQLTHLLSIIHHILQTWPLEGTAHSVVLLNVRAGRERGLEIDIRYTKHLCTKACKLCVCMGGN